MNECMYRLHGACPVHVQGTKWNRNPLCWCFSQSFFLSVVVQTCRHQVALSDYGEPSTKRIYVRKTNTEKKNILIKSKTKVAWFERVWKIKALLWKINGKKKCFWIIGKVYWNKVLCACLDCKVCSQCVTFKWKRFCWCWFSFTTWIAQRCTTKVLAFTSYWLLVSITTTTTIRK